MSAPIHSSALEIKLASISSDVANTVNAAEQLLVPGTGFSPSLPDTEHTSFDEANSFVEGLFAANDTEITFNGSSHLLKANYQSLNGTEELGGQAHNFNIDAQSSSVNPIPLPGLLLLLGSILLWFGSHHRK